MLAKTLRFRTEKSLKQEINKWLENVDKKKFGETIKGIYAPFGGMENTPYEELIAFFKRNAKPSYILYELINLKYFYASYYEIVGDVFYVYGDEKTLKDFNEKCDFLLEKQRGRR